MYYIYNRGLDAVLTAKGWVLFNDIKKDEYDIIAIQGRENFDKINKNVINKYCKTISKASILLTTNNLLSKRPKKQLISDENKRKLNCGANQLVKILCDNEAQKVNSIRIFPKESPKTIATQEEVEVEVINNKTNNDDNISYIYNEGLDAVLTTKGWIKFSSIGDDSYLLIAFTNDSDIENIKANVIGKYTSTITRSTIIISEDVLLNGRIRPTTLMEKHITILHSCVNQLIQILITKNAQKVNASRITSYNETQHEAKPIEHHKIPATGQDSDGVLRIKNVLCNDMNDFVEESLIFLKKSEEIYSKSIKILSNYDEMLSEVELQINDELHYIEFNKLDESSALEFANNLHKLRNERRKLKDGLFTANLMIKQFDEDKIEKLNLIQSKLEHLSDRSYVVRSPENFSH